MELAYSFAGLVVGFIVGLTGIGGGALMTPILIVIFGIPPAVAVSTDLLYAAITKCAGLFNYAKKCFVEYSIAGLLLLGSIPSSLITINYLKSLESLVLIEQLINLTLGISLILTAIAVFLRQKIHAKAQMKAEQNPTANDQFSLSKTLITIFMGVLLGGLVTLSSVGAGALGTALLIFLYPRLSMPAIIGTDLLHAVILTSIAGFGHYDLGNTDLMLLAYLVIGSIPGVFVGSHLGTQLSPKIMQPIMGILLLIIGLYFVANV